MDLSNDDRRRILRGQHVHLRKTIEAARSAATGALAGRISPEELQRAVSALERELLAHLGEEERLLEPILGKLDAWGPLRLTLLHAEHAHQRAVMALLALYRRSQSSPGVVSPVLAVSSACSR